MIPILYIVATPIGHLADISLRAIDVLKNVDYILVEDKRQSARLLHHYDIQTPMIAYHEHSDEKQTANIIKLLNEDKQLALISDAGTPLISDPGYRLLQKIPPHVKVVPIPGASALIAAMSASGLATNKFSFEGFLPAKEKARKKVLAELVEESRTLIFYEAPHRIKVCMQDICTVFGGDRMVCLARELTKTFETIVRLPANEMFEFICNDENQQRGECVVLIDAYKAEVISELSNQSKALALTLSEHLPPKTASKIIAGHYGVNKKLVYEYLLSLK